MTSAGLSAQYEKMWRVTFGGYTVEGDVEAMQVTITVIAASIRPLRLVCLSVVVQRYPDPPVTVTVMP